MLPSSCKVIVLICLSQIRLFVKMTFVIHLFFIGDPTVVGIPKDSSDYVVGMMSSKFKRYSMVSISPSFSNATEVMLRSLTHKPVNV